MKNFVFLFLVIGFTNSIDADVSISFVQKGTTIVDVKFSNKDFWIETQFDTSLNFNSPVFRKKISPFVLNDTIMGLKLGRTYRFRTRQIFPNGTIQSDWTYANYNTSNYPFSQYINSDKPINYITTPFHQFTYVYQPLTEFWYDTSPKFNSSRLFKTTRSSNLTPIDIPLYKNHDTIYIRARVSDQTDSLPWKSAMLVTKFKSPIAITGYIPCNDSTTFYVEMISSFRSTFPTLSSKSYIYYNGTLDSSIDYIYRLYGLKNNDPIKIFNKLSYTDGTISDFYYDTIEFNDPLNLTKPLKYVMSYSPTKTIGIFPNACNTGIELELHADTFYNNIIQSQYKNNKTSESALFFNTNWDVLSGNALRYRIIRTGIKGPWFNIPNIYTPVISYAIPIPGDDTSHSEWIIKRDNYQTGKKLEVELDINVEFNSKKKKTYHFNDSGNFRVESMFGRSNYVRCRISDGSFTSKWSNTVYKNFVYEFGQINTLFSQPNWYSIPVNQSLYSGLEMIFGHTPQNLSTFKLSPEIAFTDTFDYTTGDTVYFKLRRKTPIDTSEWSQVLKSVYKGSSTICFTPKMKYCGTANGLDTFHIKWLDKNPDYSNGMQIVFGPRKNQFKGIIEVPKGISSYVINRKQFPANWVFALYPVCKSPNIYSSVKPEWNSLNGEKISSLNDELAEKNIVYSYERGALINLTETTFQYKIHDITGRLMDQGSLYASGIKEITGLSQGIYIITITNTYNLSYSKSIIIP
jgi:hypothetical protein